LGVFDWRLLIVAVEHCCIRCISFSSLRIKNKTAGNFTSGLDVRSGAVSSLKTLFQRADVELKERIDGMVNNIKTNEPQFFVGYRTARVIHHTGGSRGDDSKDGGSTPPTPPSSQSTNYSINGVN
jgi:hypothetical protein